MSNKIYNIFFMLLPSFLKIKILKFRGHEIGKGVKIGLVYFDVKKSILKDNVVISNFNYIKGLNLLFMDENSRIGGIGNWITSSPKNFNIEATNHGVLKIGKGSNITGRHYFDVQEQILIGENTLIAGFSSVFYTHGYSPQNPNVVKSIKIGSNCYIASHCFFIPGSSIGDNSFVAANTTVSRDFYKNKNVLIAQEPAVIKKYYDPQSFFFKSNFNGLKPKKTNKVLN